MAIDGVAPRAKMNQQRSRRFRSAQEMQESTAETEHVREQLRAQGVLVPPAPSKPFDFNCITPGTAFMENLAKCLRYYIHKKCTTDPLWAGRRVILSDASVPGEGEHKIMDFVRAQREDPHYDRNTRHVLLGADADLIMLGLATHEPHFYVVRGGRPQRRRPVKRAPLQPDGPRGAGLPGAYACTRGPRPCSPAQWPRALVGLAGKSRASTMRSAGHSVPPRKRFIMSEHPAAAASCRASSAYVPWPARAPHCATSPGSRAARLQVSGKPGGFDPERAIDDWVFLCFFVGNDFLPHLPSLEIREGAIDNLVMLYKEALRHASYLTENGNVLVRNLKPLLERLAQRRRRCSGSGGRATGRQGKRAADREVPARAARRVHAVRC